MNHQRFLSLLTLACIATSTALVGCAQGEQDELYVACTGLYAGFIDDNGEPVLLDSAPDAAIVVATSREAAINDESCKASEGALTILPEVDRYDRADRPERTRAFNQPRKPRRCPCARSSDGPVKRSLAQPSACDCIPASR